MKSSAVFLAGMLPLALAYDWRVGVGKDETTGYVIEQPAGRRATRSSSMDLVAKAWVSIPAW